MRDKFPDKVEKGRLRDGPMASKTGDRFGMFVLKVGGGYVNIIASDGSDWEASGFALPAWEHVSVTVRNPDPIPSGGMVPIPTWEQMCEVKKLFWSDDECVIQFHPPASEYVNVHKGCLHLWRMIGGTFPLPPTGAV